MIHEDDSDPNFRITTYVLADDCQAHVITDKIGKSPPWYELWIDEKWKKVNEGVFKSWLRAWELGNFPEKYKKNLELNIHDADYCYVCNHHPSHGHESGCPMQ